MISQSSPSSAPVFDCNWDSLRQGDVTDLDILVAPVRLRISNALSCQISIPRLVSVPLVEKLDASNLLSDLLWQNLVALDGLDFDFSAVRHDCDLTLRVRGGLDLRGSRCGRQNNSSRNSMCSAHHVAASPARPSRGLLCRPNPHKRGKAIWTWRKDKT